MNEKEINLLVENNRLRRGLIIAERELTLTLRDGKPSGKCKQVIQEIRNALEGGSDKCHQPKTVTGAASGSG
jgi:hypothetical protein